jgi:hypothetical protein
VLEQVGTGLFGEPVGHLGLRLPAEGVRTNVWRALSPFDGILLAMATGRTACPRT